MAPVEWARPACGGGLIEVLFKCSSAWTTRMTAENTHTLPFVHLRVHSAYSLGIGLSSPRDLCAQAARYGYTSLALTDTDGTYGFVEFHRAAREFGIKPIYGADLTIGFEASAGGGPKIRYGLVVLALDRGGLKNLCALTR